MARIKGETYEQYTNRVLKESVESFNRNSIENQIEYIDYLIEVNRRPFVGKDYKGWFDFLKLILNKTKQFEKLEKFYEGLGDIEKKEFQTELHETILEYYKWEWTIKDEDKRLKEFYSLDNIDSEIEERQKQYITERNPIIETGYDEKIISTFIDGCTPKVFEELKESIKDCDLLMKNNLSSRTRKKLFSLPTYMRVYVYMEMYTTARFYEFDEWYLTDRYDARKRLRDRMKEEAKEQEETNKNEKGYVKRKYPIKRQRM